MYFILPQFSVLKRGYKKPSNNKHQANMFEGLRI